MGTEDREGRGERTLCRRGGPPRAMRVSWRASLAVASLLGGCCCLPDCRSHETPDASAEEEAVKYTMPVPVPLSVRQIWELAGKEAIKKAGVSSANEISDWPREKYERLLRKAGIVNYVASAGYVDFHDLGQTKDAVAYGVITFKDQSVVTGKYSMKLTLGQSTGGGPPGFATERFVTVLEEKLVERTFRPKPIYTDGKREIVPGEMIVHMISPAEWRIDDRYALSLDPREESEVWIIFYPSRCCPDYITDNYDRPVFSVSITDSSNRPVELVRFDQKFHFRAVAGNQYWLEISGRFSKDCHPDRYLLAATIEEYRGDYESDQDATRINWLPPTPSESK